MEQPEPVDIFLNNYDRKINYKREPNSIISYTCEKGTTDTNTCI